ncbi:MAG: tetratricopeptide repeat protein [Anaerolineae bacterium]
MRRLWWGLFIVLAAIVLLVVVPVVLWPWLSGWLPNSEAIEAWIRYLTVDLNIGRWGPVATLLLVALIELVWAINLGRKSEAFERHWDRLDDLYGQEVTVLNQEIELLKDERQALRAELELREDLIREEKERLWAQFEDLQRAGGLQRAREMGSHEVGPAILQSKLVAPGVSELPPDLRGEWRQIVSQLERIEMITSVSVRKAQSALHLQQHADELSRLGNACYALGQYQRALAHFNRASELMPNNLEALVNRAVVNMDLGRYQSSLQDLEQSLKLGENHWAYLYRAMVQERLGEERRAQENYTRAIRLKPELIEAYYRRGLLYAKAGEYEKAFQDESRVLELDGGHARAYTARGVARAALGDSQWALNDLDKGCTLAPQSCRAFYNRGLVRHELEMYSEALADFSRAIELDPQFSPVFMARGEAHAAMGEHWEAIADYDRAVEHEPKNAAAYHARGQARAAVREYERAVEDLSQALELEPTVALTLAHRGAAYEKLGDHEQAIEDLDRALALDPGLAIAYYVRGMVFGSKGEYDKASRDLNRAVELDPSLNKREHGQSDPGVS